MPIHYFSQIIVLCNSKVAMSVMNIYAGSNHCNICNKCFLGQANQMRDRVIIGRPYQPPSSHPGELVRAPSRGESLPEIRGNERERRVSVPTNGFRLHAYVLKDLA